ncbi:hypothetical protein ACFV46_12370 [Streptomyces sp. NPDC059852]|uniref:hypothetical protein n=1 Tax=Streptomyces sp. NPDC059852 TaxID=3346972 RepID=UPI00365B3E89
MTNAGGSSQRGVLAREAGDRDGAGIVSVNSTAHMRAGTEFDDLRFERRRYNPQKVYAQPKTVNSRFAVKTIRLRVSGLVAN